MTFPHFSNWRTTLAGTGALVYAVADLIVMFHNKEWDSTRLGTSLMAILTGLGLVAARDNAAAQQAHAIDRAAIIENAAQIADTQATAVVAHTEAVAAAKTAEVLAATVEQHIEKQP